MFILIVVLVPSLYLHNYIIRPLLSHPNPSALSVYPSTQEQVNVPSSLVQLWAHPPLLLSHSLMSGKKERYN